MHLISWLSVCIFFWSFDLFFHLSHIFYLGELVTVVRDGALLIGQGGATPHHLIVMLCVVEGPRGNTATCSALVLLSVTPSATHNQIGPLWCWFPSGWACAHFRPLWVSPTNSPVRLGVSPAAAPTPTGVFNLRFEALFPALEPWVAWSVLLPSCSSWFIHIQMWDYPLCWLPPAWVASLAVNLPHPAARLHPSYGSG